MIAITEQSIQARKVGLFLKENPPPLFLDTCMLEILQKGAKDPVDQGGRRKV